uniref:Peptidase S1 domain-containing protein n=1 Tax=Rhodnius prolixus TaxID=13249 RepID=T1HAB6_RHOPR
MLGNVVSKKEHYPGVDLKFGLLITILVLYRMQWWCWLLCAVTLCGVAGDNVTTTITSSSSTTTTEGYNETTIITTTFPTTTDMTTLHPEQLPGKPSKFDVDISDKIYVDTKSEDFAILLSNDIKTIYSIYGCGLSVKSQAAQRRIVGGDEAGFGSFPWQVSPWRAYIRIGSSRCGGSLVNRYHVVTAGHCVARANARQVQVTLGDYVINSAVEPLPAYTYGVRQISVHPYFKFTPQADRFDVAVLRLDRPVQYMPHIAPICLPTKGSRLRPKTLQAVDVPVIDNRLCERWHRSNGINVVIYDEMMCAGYRGGTKDSCQGDSGGPLMLERSGRWYLIGIVSAGYSCAQRGQPGIYHRVAHTVDWISHIINS